MYVGNDRRPSQKSGTCRENRNAADFPNLFATIPDDGGCLRFPVFISRESLGRSGNSEISDRLGFSRHVKTRLYYLMQVFSSIFDMIRFLQKITGWTVKIQKMREDLR